MTTQGPGIEALIARRSPGVRDRGRGVGGAIAEAGSRRLTWRAGLKQLLVNLGMIGVGYAPWRRLITMLVRRGGLADV